MQIFLHLLYQRLAKAEVFILLHWQEGISPILDTNAVFFVILVFPKQFLVL